MISPTLMIFDAHAPEHDRRLHRALVAWTKDHQPTELIMCGDNGEFASCSQHGTNGEWGQLLKKDVEAVNAYVALFRQARRNLRVTMLEGNHESRVARLVRTQAPGLAGFIDLADHLDCDAYVREQAQPLRRGSLLVMHGHQLDTRGRGASLKRALEVYGGPGKTVVFGHTHRAQSITAARWPAGTAGAVNVGAARSLKVHWQSTKENGWSAQIAIAYVASRRTQLYVVDVKDGGFTWSGKHYGGKR